MIIVGTKNTYFTFYTLLAIVLIAGKLAFGQNFSGVSDIVTDAFFDRIASKAGEGCPGRGFYSRPAFLNALGPYPEFGSGTIDVARREIAAFFAHVTYETGSLCYIEEIGGRSGTFCDNSNRQYPCVPGKSYYGRGPLQLSWSFNYGAAGRSIGFDGLTDPDIVARDPVVSFKTALWLWMNNCHDAITSGQGFGATIRARVRLACDGSNPAVVNFLVQNFRNYCSELGVDPGGSISC